MAFKVMMVIMDRRMETAMERRNEVRSRGWKTKMNPLERGGINVAENLGLLLMLVGDENNIRV